jgi:hypothetical protein
MLLRLRLLCLMSMIFRINVKCRELLNKSSLSEEDIYSNHCPHYCHLRVHPAKRVKQLQPRDFMGIPLHTHQV